MPQDPFAALGAKPVQAQPVDPFAILGAKPVTPPRVTLDKSKTDQPITITDFLKGIVKSGAGVVEAGGNLLREIPGMNAASAAIGETRLPLSTKPSNPTQSAGKMVGDVGQFFIPVAGEGKMATSLASLYGKGAAKLPAVVKNMTLTAAQGGGPISTGLAGGLTAALPGGGAAQRVSQSLSTSAEKNMAQALGATTDKMKAQAAKLAPEMLERGVKGSRATMLAEAQAQVKKIGTGIGDVVKTAAQSGDTVSGQSIRAQMGTVMPTLFEADSTGALRVIPGQEAAVQQMAKLDRFIESLGPDIPVDKAQRLKTAWDRIVSKAGLYGPKAASSSTDEAKAWAFREAASAFRDKLSRNPTLAELNQEYAFWKGLKDVLSKTELRTQAQGPGLTSTLAGGAGAVIGAAHGGLAEAGVGSIVGGLLGQQAMKLIQSPYWKTSVSAPLKNALADALASDNAARAGSIMNTIIASLPSQVGQQFGGSK